MTAAPTLLDEQGRASMATLLMIIHHGLRRDVRRLTAGSATLDGAALDEAWTTFRTTLHGHHEIEDARLLPGIRAAQPELAPILDQLARDHHAIDPLLARIDDAVRDGTRDAVSGLLAELSAFLERHLATEEEHLVPLLRTLPAAPPPITTEKEAEGFAAALSWSEDGVAPDVIAAAYAALPAPVVEKLPAAREAYAARRARSGTSGGGVTRTALPA